MNNTYFIFLLRRDPVSALLAHLAAGIAALAFLTAHAAPERVAAHDAEQAQHGPVTLDNSGPVR